MSYQAGAPALDRAPEVKSRPIDVPGVRRPSLRSAFILGLLAATLWLAAQVYIRTHGPTWMPHVDDEFSVLMQADTFVHGRLTNPPHPLGKFWESPHTLIRPTYTSKYPPGTAAWLAAGKWLFGSFWAGVLLQDYIVILLFALTLSAWVSLRVTAVVVFAAGCCMLLPPAVWVNSYYGGGAPAVMGSLCVLWGLGRLLNAGAVRSSAILMAAGGFQLFWSRAYEGFCLCMAVAACFLWAAHVSRIPLAATIRRLALFAAPVLIVGLSFNAYYNWRVTGSAFQTPYLLHEKTYIGIPAFCFLSLKPDPPFPNQRLAAVQSAKGWEGRTFLADCSGHLWFLNTFWAACRRFLSLIKPFAGFLLLIPLGWRSRNSRMLLVITAVAFFAVVLEGWQYDRYFTPAFAAFVVFIGCVLEFARFHPKATARSRIAVASALVLSVSAFMLYQYAKGYLFYYQAPEFEFGAHRAALIDQLSRRDRPQLVLVHYKNPSVCDLVEWVYNGADPDGQKVLFAHDLGAAEDKALLSYYRNRTQWLLTPQGKECEKYTLQPLSH